MSNFRIVTDNTADMPESFYQEHQIEVLSLTYMLEGQTYDRHHSLSMPEFYQKMRAGAMPSTSQVNPQAAEEGMKAIADQGLDILCLSFSSGLSGTYNSCRMAAEALKEQGYKNKIIVIDSLCASTGMGLLLYKACQMKEQGASLQETADWVEAHKLNVCHVFTVDDLNHLYRGGRVSKTAAMVGTMINIKPMLHVDNEGHLVLLGKVHGRKKSLHALVDMMAERIGSYREQNDLFMICQGDVQDEAQTVEDLVSERFGIQQSVISYTGPVIGSHTGAGVIGLFFFGDHR